MNRTKSMKKGIKTVKKTISGDKKQKALKKTKLHNTIKEKRSTPKLKRTRTETRNKKNTSAEKNWGIYKKKRYDVQ